MVALKITLKNERNRTSLIKGQEYEFTVNDTSSTPGTWSVSSGLKITGEKKGLTVNVKVQQNQGKLVSIFYQPDGVDESRKIFENYTVVVR